MALTLLQLVYIITLLGAVVLNSVLAILALGRRGVPGTRPFAGLMLAAAWWAATSALETLAWDIHTEIWISKIAYFGKECVPVFFLLFALDYTRLSSRLSARFLAGLWLIPALTWAMVLTNDFHGLMWSHIYPEMNGMAGVYIYEHGPWFWLVLIYNYLLILAGSMLLAYFAVRLPNVYRRQAVALLLGVAVTWVANALYIFKATPPGLDLTPLGSAVTGVIYAWGILRLHLFDLVPVARSVLIEELGDGVIVLDMEWRIVDINPAAFRLLGLSLDVIGQPVAQAFPPWQGLAAEWEEQERIKQEIVLPGTPPRHLEISKVALRDPGGRLTGRLLTLRDISDYKELERQRSDLIHMIVHDLRNPLSNLTISLEAIADVPENERQVILGLARSSVGKMTELVNSILDINRLERGAIDLDPAALNLASLVQETLQEQAPLAHKKQVEVSTDLPPDLPLVRADLGLLRRVIQNLLGNALAFTPQGGKIHICLHVDEAKQMLVFTISDSGPGISSAVEPHLFQMFGARRVGGSASGTGIGLAFCRLAVEAQGGQIWTEKNIEQGARFYFSLPIFAEG